MTLKALRLLLALCLIPFMCSTASSQQMVVVRHTVRDLEEAAREQAFLTKNTAIPYQAFPDVAFTVGYGASMHKERDPVHGFVLSTNLLGAASGGAFGMIGIEALKDYLVDNTANTITFPTDGADKLGVGLELALGEVSFKGVTVWPVLGMHQFDSADPQIPSETLASAPDEETWAAPFVGFGFLLGGREDVALRLSDPENKSNVFPVLSVGVGLPFYYAGNSFSALGAVFTEPREFEREGDVALLVSLSVPLFPIEPVTREIEQN